MKILLPSWLGKFYGADFSFEELEYRTITNFKEPVRKFEADLYNTKWFDYVRLHPLQATYYFAECYRHLYTRYSKQYFGEEKVGVKQLDFLQSREKTAFWSARISADKIGVPYLWFISKAFEHQLESGAFKNRLPRPCHLVTPDDLPIFAEMWKRERSGNVLSMSADPFFCAKRWQGTPEQTRYEDFLVQQVKHRSTKRFVLATLVYEKQALRIERAMKEFPDEIAEAQYEAEHSFNPRNS